MAETKRPADTPFKQQRMTAWEPILTPMMVIGIFLLVGIIFIPVGTHLMSHSDEVYETTKYYDGSGRDIDCKITTPNEGKVCAISFTFDEDVTGPVHVYYELKNYYQNHRRYVKSRSAAQLYGITSGSDVSSSQLDLDCDPTTKIGNLTLNPCGLIANSFFNDEISLTTSSVSGVELDESDIAWKSDVDTKFKQPDGFMKMVVDSTQYLDCDTTLGEEGSEAWTDTSVVPNVLYCYYYPDNDETQYLYETYPNQISPIVGVEDEHFIVWMRTAVLPMFRKLYGKLDDDFSKGDTVEFSVTANFEVDSYSASKGLVLSTTNVLGGQNPNLGASYVTVGSISLVLAVFFAIKNFFFPRELGTAAGLHWE